MILDDARSYIARFCAFPNDHCLNAVTLWAAHCHLVDSFDTSPRLALISPEPGSGKTRVLEVLEVLTPAPMFCLSASPAAIFRTLEDGPITLLFDEVDTVFTRKGAGDSNEDLRALLNAGYRRGASIPRCVGPRHEVMRFPVFAPVALAGIGEMPDTIMSRSIIARMRRRGPDEIVEPFRRRDNAPDGNEIRECLGEWAADIADKIARARPALPEGVTDRPADVWEPLIAIADEAGGHWPDTARAACVHLIAAAQDRRQSLGVRLLGDLRIIFSGEIALFTREIIERLKSPEENGLELDAPWADLGGVGLTDRKLAAILKAYSVESKKIKRGGAALQGYRREDLWDAWSRYLPPLSESAEPPEPVELANDRAPSKVLFGVPDADTNRNSPGTFSNGGGHEKSGTVPEVPQVPVLLWMEGACPKCDGEGCGWCSARGAQ